jgi:putative hydroxymethylpyrimidine transport system substrate-binding protein
VGAARRALEHLGRKHPVRPKQTPGVTLTVAALVLVGALGVGCGEKEENPTGNAAQPFDLALDFYVNPDHAGIYTALDRGYFEEAGLDVNPQAPSDPSSPIKQVATGTVDLAISYEPEVMLAHDQGLPVVAVAALVPSPLTSLISLPEAKVRDVADLRGKTVATAGIPYQADFLETMLDEAGVPPGDVDQVDVGLNLLPAVLSGRADAILGGFLNVEGVDLEERGKDPRVVPVDELGVPTYDELVLVANTDDVENDPESLRLFIAALERGTTDAVDDPAAATDAVLRAGDGLDPKLTRAEVERTLPLLESQSGNHPYGYMDPAEWETFAGFFADRGLIEQRPTADDLLTNDLLPGEIPD